MPLTNMPLTNKAKAEPAFARYAFAVVACGIVFALRFEVNRRTGVVISLPLCGLAAVISCIWRAGFGPALIATALTTAWYVYASPLSASPEPDAWLHCLIYAVEAVVLCIYGGQLRLAKDRAAKGEDWQEQLVETAGEGIWMIDLDGVIGYANPRMSEILGCPPDQMTGRRLDDFLFPEDLPAERIRLQNRRAGVREQFDRHLRRPDGSEVWVLACSSFFKSGQSDAVILTMMTDITERKAAEHALRHSERKYRELFENILEGLYQTSPDGRILAANAELLRMLNFSTQEELSVPGVVRDTFVDPDLHVSLRDRLERDGRYANVEFQLRTRDHRIITVRENARVVRDENGGVLYYEGSLTDITGQIRFEKQLRQAQNMEALGRLAGGIARDFRGIGAGMANSLDLALRALPSDHPARPHLDSVARSMQSSAALTQQILDFSHRQSGHADDALIDVNDFVRRMESEYSLELSLTEMPTSVVVDPGHLKRAITSFLVHSRESGSGAGKIVLSTAIEANGPADTVGPFVSLSVRCAAMDKDNGNFEVRPWIGMETTQAILAQYGGMMIATAERYSLYLPLAGDAAASRHTSAAVEPLATVLLVEEEPLIRELSRDMLERQGFRVLTAGNASEAERIARGQDTFDVLITAWTTAGVTGMALVQLLRSVRPDLRVLFVAGYSDGSADSNVAPEGSAILQKPFSGESLGRKIRLLLDEK